MSKVNYRWFALLGLGLVALLAVTMLACAPSAAPTATPVPTAPATAPVVPAATVAPAKVGSTTKESITPTAATVKVANIGLMTDVPMFVAMERGYFKEQGINLELTKFTNSGEMMAPLGSGQIDVGGGATNTAIFNGIARGIKVKFVADMMHLSPTQSHTAIVVRKDLVDSGKVKDYRDLKGLKVGLGCTGGCGADIQLARGLELGGLTLKDVDLMQMPFPDIIVALVNKSLDAGLQVEPLISIGEAQGVLVRWKKGQEFYPGHQAAVYLYSPALMEKSPDVAKRFMVGLLKGKRDFFEAMERGKDKEAIYAIIVKNTATKDAKLIDRMREIGVIGAVDPDGYVNADSIKYDMDWIVAQGHMPSAPPLKDIVDNQWVDYAVQQLGRYK